jgi:hypothetical protein
MILLPTDDLVLYERGQADEHGWVQPGGEMAWAGRGAVQLAAGVTNSDAGSGGGHGPHDPASAELGTVYLPVDAPAADGMVLEARGRRYTLGQTRFIPDPTGGGADCQVAALTEQLVDVEQVSV